MSAMVMPMMPAQTMTGRIGGPALVGAERVGRPRPGWRRGGSVSSGGRPSSLRRCVRTLIRPACARVREAGGRRLGRRRCTCASRVLGGVRLPRLPGPRPGVLLQEGQVPDGGHDRRVELLFDVEEWPASGEDQIGAVDAGASGTAPLAHPAPGLGDHATLFDGPRSTRPRGAPAVDDAAGRPGDSTS